MNEKVQSVHFSLTLLIWQTGNVKQRISCCFQSCTNALSITDPRDVFQKLIILQFEYDIVAVLAMKLLELKSVLELNKRLRVDVAFAYDILSFKYICVPDLQRTVSMKPI